MARTHVQIFEDGLMALVDMDMPDLRGRREDESEWARGMLARGEAILLDGSAEKRKALEAERRQSAQPVAPADTSAEQPPSPPRTQLPLERRLSLQDMATRIKADKRRYRRSHE
jgi:hypothetical protein